MSCVQTRPAFRIGRKVARWKALVKIYKSPSTTKSPSIDEFREGHRLAAHEEMRYKVTTHKRLSSRRRDREVRSRLPNYEEEETIAVRSAAKANPYHHHSQCHQFRVAPTISSQKLGLCIRMYLHVETCCCVSNKCGGLSLFSTVRRVNPCVSNKNWRGTPS